MHPAGDHPPPVGPGFAPQGPGCDAFWDATLVPVAAWLRGGDARGAPTEAGLGPHRPLAVVVARGTLVAPVQAALARSLGMAGRTWAPPRVQPLEQWAAELAPQRPIEPVGRLLSLLRALDDGAPGLMLGRSSAERLAFAASLLQVLDAVAVARRTGRLDATDASLAQAFGAPIAAPLVRDDLALLEAVRAAMRGPDPVALRLAQLDALADAWSAQGAVVAWLGWQPPDPFEWHLLAALAQRTPAPLVLRLEPNWPAVCGQAPVLAAAWPELLGDAVAPLPLRERRAAWRGTRPETSDTLSTLDTAGASGASRSRAPAILHAADREAEAQLAARWVHARLQAAASSTRPFRLAIVALDRWLARRIRALLERARVLVDDRGGWLLSTTVAASAVTGWLDVVSGSGHYNDLLGWLDSRFVALPDVRAVRTWVDERSARHRYLRGWRGLLHERAPPGIGWLAAAAGRQRRRQTLAAHLACLREVLEQAGTPARLGADAAGRQVLAVLRGLELAAAAGAGGGAAAAAGGGDAPRTLSLADFRALVAMLFERRTFRDESIESPVEMLTLAEAAGRPFDAAIVVGAAGGALPAPPAPLPLVNEALRTLLGLPDAAGHASQQQRDLALLLALTPRVALTCRTDPEEGVQPGAWVQRLHAVVGDAPLERRFDAPGEPRRLVGRAATMPAWPLVPLPQSVSAGSIERLVACPFRFLVQDGWRLREPDEPVDVPGARERGEFVHEVLEAFHREAAAAGLEPMPTHRDALRDLLLEVTDRLARAALDAGGGYLGEIAAWRALVDAYLDWLLADAQAGWRWREGEQSLQVLVPWQDDGEPKTLRVTGRVDRLDAAPAGLRIIDYKLGDPARLTGLARDPSRAAQLVLYAWMAAGRGPVAASAYLSLRRDEVRLIPLGEPPADAVASWQRALPRYLARIGRGEPLAAIGSDCGHCASRGVCRKGHWS